MRDLGAQNLDGDVALVSRVAREIDGRHPAMPELALDRVSIAEGIPTLTARVGVGGHDSDEPNEYP